MAKPRINKKRRPRTKWFKLERLVGEEKLFVQDVEGHDFHVREDVEGLLVVQTPRNRPPEDLVKMREVVISFLKKAQVDLPVLFVPDDIEFARFRKLHDHEAQELERRCEQPGYRAGELKANTPTEGSA